jgi:membrane associated rhomboid family serine protease
VAAEFIDKVKAQFSSASVLMRFIYVNIGVFILLRIAAVVLKMFNLDINVVLDYVSMPSVLSILAIRPWTAITYMFAHYDVWHILFNMLWFYWFGKMFLDVFSPRKFFGLYILGGLGGAALYLICYNILPFFETHPAMLIGASASIIAIVVATAMKSPQRRITLFPFGSFSLKWIAIITIAIDLLSVGRRQCRRTYSTPRWRFNRLMVRLCRQAWTRHYRMVQHSLRINQKHVQAQSEN